MDVSDPCMVQYANTITGLSEYHLMKDALVEVFGEGQQIDFENIEEMKQVVVQTYADKEMEFINAGASDGDENEEQKEEIEVVQEIEDSKTTSGFTPEEITQHLSK